MEHFVKENEKLIGFKKTELARLRNEIDFRRIELKDYNDKVQEARTKLKSFEGNLHKEQAEKSYSSIIDSSIQLNPYFL